MVESRIISGPRLLEAQECAELLLLLIKTKKGSRPKGSRFRISELSLKRMWRRHWLNMDFITLVNEYMFSSGYALFYAGSSYGVIKVSAVESWARLSSKLISGETEGVLGGSCELSIDEANNLQEAEDDED